MRIILASASPRRRELLSQIVPEFEVIISESDETVTEDTPSGIAMELASQKAESVIRKTERIEEARLIIAADTIVVQDGRVLGKPLNEADAYRMLSGLSGKTHQVYTGVCLFLEGDARTERRAFFEKTDVDFYPMTEEEIREYISTGDPFDKAGAYGIQSGCAKYIREIRGDYYNVVGLPVSRLYHEMKNINIYP